MGEHRDQQRSSRAHSSTVTWGCAKGSRVRIWQRSHNRAGLYTLPFAKGKDSCQVTASAIGSGQITVQILKG